MMPEDIAEGALVALAEDPDNKGVVKKRDGQRVRVDFSASGGKASTWVDASDLVLASEAQNSDDESDGGSPTSRRRGGSPVPVPLTERYEAKLRRKKLELEVVGMGLQTFDKKGKPVEKWLFQNMMSWESTDSGFNLTLNGGEVLNFTCDRGEQLCQVMTEKASVLAEEHALRQSGAKKLELAGFLDSKGYAAHTLRVKDAMVNIGITEADEMVEMLQDMSLTELDQFIQACKTTPSAPPPSPPPPPPPPPPPGGDSSDVEAPSYADSNRSSRDEPPVTFDIPEPDPKFDAKWKRKPVKVQASGMSLQVYGKNDKPVANFLYQQCQSWGPTAKGFQIQHMPDQEGFEMIEFTCAQGQQVCDLMTVKAKEMIKMMKKEKAAAKRRKQEEKKQRESQQTALSIDQDQEPEPEPMKQHEREDGELLPTVTGRYAVTRKAALRATVSLDSEVIGELKPGQVVEALEARLWKGAKRVRLDNGWTSLVNRKGVVLLQQMSSDDDVQVTESLTSSVATVQMSSDEDLQVTESPTSSVAPNEQAIARAPKPRKDAKDLQTSEIQAAHQVAHSSPHDEGSESNAWSLESDNLESPMLEAVNILEKALISDDEDKLAIGGATAPLVDDDVDDGFEPLAPQGVESPGEATQVEGGQELTNEHAADQSMSKSSPVPAAESPAVSLSSPSAAAGELNVNPNSPWVSYLDDDGDEYWYNEKTQQSVYTEPSEGVQPRHMQDYSVVQPAASSMLGHVNSSKFQISQDRMEDPQDNEEDATVQQLRQQIAQLKADHDKKIQAMEQQLQRVETAKRRALADADVRCQALVQQADSAAEEMALERERRQALERALNARQNDEDGIKAAEVECDANCVFIAKLELHISQMQAENSILVQNATATVKHLTERLRETEEALELTKSDALAVATAHQRLAEIQYLQSQSAVVETVVPQVESCASQTETVKLASDVTSRAVEALKSQCTKEVMYQRERAEIAESRVAELEEQIQTLETAAFATDVQQKTKDKAAAYELAEAHEVIAALSKDMTVASHFSAYTQHTESATLDDSTRLQLTTDRLHQAEIDLHETRAGHHELESQLAAASQQAMELRSEMQHDVSLTEGAVVWAERILDIFTQMHQDSNSNDKLELDEVIMAEKKLGDQAEEELQALRLKFQELMRADCVFHPSPEPEPEPEPQPTVEILPKVELDQKLEELQRESKQQLSVMASELRKTHAAELEAREKSYALKASEATAAQDELIRLRDEAVARYDSAMQRAQSAEDLVVPYQHQLRRLSAEAEAAHMRASEAERAQREQEVETHAIRARLMKMVEDAEEERRLLEQQRAALNANPANPEELQMHQSRAEAARVELQELQGRYQALESDTSTIASRCELAETELARDRKDLQRLRDEQIHRQAAMAVAESTITECQDQLQWLRAELQHAHADARLMKTAVEQARADATRWRVELANAKCHAAIAIGKKQAAVADPTSKANVSLAALEPTTTTSYTGARAPRHQDNSPSSTNEQLEQMRRRLSEMEGRARATLSATSSPSTAGGMSAQYDVDSGTWHYHRSETSAPTSPQSTNGPPQSPTPVLHASVGSEARARATLSQIVHKLSRVQSDLDDVRGGILPSPMT